jgi:chromosome transmission fidelity protein 18
MESTTLDSMFHSSNVLSGRPNCLVVDEVDGVDTKSTIEAIVKIIKAEIPPTGSSNKGSMPYLRRPIVFICNNKYAPALKPLLPYCRFQFTVYPPQTTRLVARLRTVLAAENLAVHSGNSFLLNQLVTLSSGDIRSCLFTLQFAASNAEKNTKSLSKFSSSVTKDISRSLTTSLQGAGLKDQRNDFASAVATVFRRPKEVKNYGSYLQSITNDVKAAVDRVVDRVMVSKH